MTASWSRCDYAWKLCVPSVPVIVPCFAPAARLAIPSLPSPSSASCHATSTSPCLQALAQATGKSMQKVKAEYDKEGDLGTVAANARSSQKTMFQSAPLTVRAVFK